MPEQFNLMSITHSYLEAQEQVFRRWTLFQAEYKIPDEAMLDYIKDHLGEEVAEQFSEYLEDINEPHEP